MRRQIDTYSVNRVKRERYSLQYPTRRSSARKWYHFQGLGILLFIIYIKNYYMAESVFAMRLVNLRSVTCYTNQNFKENAHFGALNPFTSEKKIEIKLLDVYQP